MGDTHKPRHIRDIAHLYISSSQSKWCAPCTTLLTAGEDRRCFSGFHAANLAATLAAKDMSVHLFERSGLLPNAGFFMSLPPRRYIRWEEDEEAGAAGIGGVTIDCSLEGVPTSKDDSRLPRVELVHLPPTFPEKPFHDSLREVRDFVKPLTVFLLLRVDRTTRVEIPEWVVKDIRPALACVLCLDDAVRSRHDDDPSVLDLGNVADWKGAMGDRVPVAVRAPNSALSRAYCSTCDNLLFKINEFRRKTGAAHAFGVSAGS